MANADPVIELQVGASPARRYKQIRLQAAAFAGYVDRGRDGFTLTTRLLRLSRFEANELVAIITATWGWKHTTATVDGRPISKFDLAGAVRCWREREDAPTRTQVTHCAKTPAAMDAGTVPEEHRPPCRMYLSGEAVRWGDHAPNGTTDHRAMEAAMVAAGSGHPFAWCPAFDVEPALAKIRKLPASRTRTRDAERRKRERAEVKWQETRDELQRRMQEANERESSATWLEVTVERLTAHGHAALSSDDWARIADETGVSEMRNMPDAATMTEPQRDRLIERLRELRFDEGTPTEEPGPRRRR